MKRFLSISIIFVVSVFLSACGESGDNSKQPVPPAATGPQANSVEIFSSNISGLGSVLVDAKGRTLYIFAPDNGKKVTCVGSCAAAWPPAFVPDGKKPLAQGDVKQALLGTAPSPEGGLVVTYNGWPLYTYVADTSPGQAVGQALDVNGGLWYVIAPSGSIIKKSLG